MTTRFRVPGNPVRQLLVAGPLGVLITSVVFDLVATRTGAGIWWTYSWVALYAGVALAVITLPLTLVDILAPRSDDRLHRVRRLHGLLHGAAVLMFLGSWMLRDMSGGVSGVAQQLSLGGAVVAVIAGWLGDALVVRMRTLPERRRGAGRPTRYAFHPQG